MGDDIYGTLAECLGDATRATLPHLRLEALADLRMGVEEATRAAVIEWWCAGASWTSIGAALGITRQGAAKVYGEAARAAQDRRLAEHFAAQRAAGYGAA